MLITGLSAQRVEGTEVVLLHANKACKQAITVECRHQSLLVATKSGYFWC